MKSHRIVVALKGQPVRAGILDSEGIELGRTWALGDLLWIDGDRAARAQAEKNGYAVLPESNWPAYREALSGVIQAAGGRARAKNMSKAARSESASIAARARWGKTK